MSLSSADNSLAHRDIASTNYLGGTDINTSEGDDNIVQAQTSSVSQNGLSSDTLGVASRENFSATLNDPDDPSITSSNDSGVIVGASSESNSDIVSFGEGWAMLFSLMSELVGMSSELESDSIKNMAKINEEVADVGIDQAAKTFDASMKDANKMIVSGAINLTGGFVTIGALNLTNNSDIKGLKEENKQLVNDNKALNGIAENPSKYLNEQSGANEYAKGKKPGRPNALAGEGRDNGLLKPPKAVPPQTVPPQTGPYELTPEGEELTGLKGSEAKNKFKDPAAPAVAEDAAVENNKKLVKPKIDENLKSIKANKTSISTLMQSKTMYGQLISMFTSGISSITEGVYARSKADLDQDAATMGVTKNTLDKMSQSLSGEATSFSTAHSQSVSLLNSIIQSMGQISRSVTQA